jgi:hypothetical protein
VIGTMPLRLDDAPTEAIDEVVEASRADPVVVGTASMVRGGRVALRQHFARVGGVPAERIDFVRFCERRPTEAAVVVIPLLAVRAVRLPDDQRALEVALLPGQAPVGIALLHEQNVVPLGGERNGARPGKLLTSVGGRVVFPARSDIRSLTRGPAWAQSLQAATTCSQASGEDVR